MPSRDEILEAIMDRLKDADLPTLKTVYRFILHFVK